jgi:hypothetical protein
MKQFAPNEATIEVESKDIAAAFAGVSGSVHVPDSNKQPDTEN